MADAQSTANRAIEMRRARGRAYYYRHREKILEIERAKREPARIAARNRAIEQGRRPHGEGRDLDKRKATRRAWYARNPDARRKHAENAAAYRHKSPEARERWRQWKRNARAKKGATPRSAIRERAWDKLAEQNARQAWRWWLKNAPDWWIADYYSAQGRPWGNPRLSIADAYRMRYAMDTDFYHREYARLQAKKVRQRSVLGRRVGELSAAELRDLRESAEGCHYCGRQLVLLERTIDHVVPLIAGGRHERGNVVVSCRSCNSKKGDRMTCGALGRHQKVLPSFRPCGS